MGWLHDGHVAALAYQADVQARLDRESEISAEDVFCGCVHRGACARAQRLLHDSRRTGLPWAVLQCEECDEWEEVSR